MPPASEEETEEELFHRARELESMDRREDAVALYQKVLKINPDNWAAHVNLGVIAGSFSREEEAIQHYETAIAIKPDCAEALTNLGNIHIRRGDFDAALAAGRKALEAEPWNVVAQLNFVVGLKRSGGVQAAYDYAVRIVANIEKETNFEFAEDAGADTPGYREALYNTACYSALLGKREEALDFLGRSIEIWKEARSMARQDGDFESLRDDPGFLKITGP